ncbi:hypothetical protein [Streptomyces sp. NPDC001108]
MTQTQTRTEPQAEPETRQLTPYEAVRAAAAVIRMRGYYQPLSRMWEEQVPTAMDVTSHVYGWEPIERGDRARIDRAAAELPPGTVEEVLAWCLTPPAQPHRFRTALARAAAAEHVQERDIPLIAAGVGAWRQMRRRANYATQAERDRSLSTHQGEPGERLARRLTVANITAQPPRAYGYVTQERFLIKLRDQHGHVYVWPAQPKDPGTLPQQGQTIDARATVTRHETYRETAQTWVKQLRWKPAAK